MLWRRIIFFPFALLYGGIITLRNWFFNLGILSQEKVEASVLSVGNLSVGGTGKTPHVEFLTQTLKKEFQTAILLRGYGRITKGYREVKEDSTPMEVGDEALTYARKFKEEVKVVVCEKRVDGAQKLLKKYPDTEVIILDDAYQHRYIKRDFNLLLMEYHRPIFKDFVLPAGRLREFASGKKRADAIMVTKSPTTLNEKQKEVFLQKLNPQKGTPVFFSSIQYGALKKMGKEVELSSVNQVVLVTGIGNPIPLIKHLEKSYQVEHFPFPDHYQYRAEDIERIHKLFDNFVGSGKIIITTEKDAVRILNSPLKESIKDYPWYYQPMEIEIQKEDKFINLLKRHVTRN